MEPRPPVALVLMKLSNTTSNRSVIWRQTAAGSERSSLSTTEMFLDRAVSHLAQASPDFGLDGWIHLLLIDGHGDEFVQNGRDALTLGIVVVLTEANQVQQPGSHVLQAQVLQFNTCSGQKTDI